MIFDPADMSALEAANADRFAALRPVDTEQATIAARHSIKRLMQERYRNGVTR